MLYVFLVVLCCSATLKTGSAVKLCDPANHICAGRCPPVPRGLQLQSQAICLKDTHGACVCFLRNPSSHIDSFFQCEVEKNGYKTQILCQAPDYCFPPRPEPGCLIIPNCSCSLNSQRAPDLKFDHWSVLKEAIVHTAVRTKEKDSEGNQKEKVQGDVREFSLKHLLFLLGFVVAPLICWCFLNCFHGGKCRKKEPQPSEAQRIPTERGSTVDNMNNNEDVDSNPDNAPEAVPSITRAVSITLEEVPVALPSAPLEPEVVLRPGGQTQMPLKCESPPPYCESTDGNWNPDCGPPPSYEDAIRGTDINIQQTWQAILILPSGARENA